MGLNLLVQFVAIARWQAHYHPKFASNQFQIDWDKQVALCPKGHQSQTWSEKVDESGQPIIDIRFPQSACRACPSLSRCTRAQTQPRGLTIRSQNEYLALSDRRAVQTTPEFLQIYRHRAGIEGTLSQGIRRSDLRQSRYIGLAKTHLQHILMAAALNLCRLDAWVNGIPLAPTRYSRFLKLRPKTG